MPSNWEDKATCQQVMWTAAKYAKDTRNYYVSIQNAVWTCKNAIDDTNAQAAVGYILNTLDILQWCMRYLGRYDSNYLPVYAFPYYLEHHCGGEPPEEYELTADKIIAAWIAAKKSVRLFTVLTLDELRREVWNERVEHFTISKAPG